LTRGMSEGPGTTFQGRQTLFEHVCGRIHDAGVNIAQFL